MRFVSRLDLDGKTATGIAVPAEVVEAMGQGRKPAVAVTINGHTYRSTVGTRGGVSKLPVSAEVRAAAGIAAGDEVTVDVEPDTAPRVVEVPADLSAALAATPGAPEAFAALSYSNQSRHVLSVEGAKTPETRERRVAKVVAALLDQDAEG